MNHDLISYYRARAGEYEKIYHKPERQSDLGRMATLLQDLFAGKRLLEIACGTGYWTEMIATTATSVLATDINASVIEVAKTKYLPPEKVSFEVANLYNLRPAEKYEAVFGGFIWSHILLGEMERFLQAVFSLVKPGGLVVFADNCYVPGSSTPVAFTDEEGNSFQIRKLLDGSTHQVLKNFPSEDFLRQTLEKYAVNVRIIGLEYYWIAVGEEK